MDLIISHINCDFDALASMLAASLLFPEAQMCLVGSTEQTVKLFLERNNNRFNFLKEKNVKLSEVKRVITVDNRDLDRMGKIGEFLTLHPSIPVLAFDHHPESKNDVKSTYSHVELTGACTTIMYQLLEERGILIDNFTASLFALGIYEDTGHFLHANTTAKDMFIASKLLSQGASLNFINKYLHPNLSQNQLVILNSMINSVENLTVKGIEFAITALELDHYQENISYMVQIFQRTEKLDMVICMFHYGNKTTLIARNRYDFLDIGLVMKQLGGGGHKSAGSAVINKKDNNELKTEILALISAQIEHNGTAADIMTSSVETIPSSLLLADALDALTHKKYSSLLIADNNILKGLITSKDLTKLAQHRMLNLPVENFMTTNLIIVSPDTSIIKIKQLILENSIGRIPVVEGGQLKGIITRRDILKGKQIQIKESQFVDNITNLMKKQFLPEQMTLLGKIGYVAEYLNMKVYLVGGVVRDLLLAQPNQDIDIVVEGDAIEYARVFSQKFGKRYVYFSKFGTAIITLGGSHKIDVATARTESYSQPGILPEVEASTLKHDLYRRDFTINAMAVELDSARFGNFIDYFGGRRALQLKILKVLHNLSFIDDPTRILRAVRFEQRFGFRIESRTLHLLNKALCQDSLKTVAPERIRQELILAAKEQRPENFFNRLQELSILKRIYQPLCFDAEKKVIFNNIFENLIWFKRSFPDDKTEAWVIYHLGLVHDLKHRSKVKFSDMLKYPKIFMNALDTLDWFAEKEIVKLQCIENKSLITESLQKLSNELLLYLLSIPQENGLKLKIKSYLLEWRYVKLEINGEDIKKLGINEGKRVGELLKAVQREKLDHGLKGKQEELEFLNRLR